MEESIIFDNIKKVFEKVRDLGHGGFGTTVLVRDTVTDTFFAIKKLDKLYFENTGEDFKRFVSEIKILFQLSNNNVVRVYNYYLYPDALTGYIQMEYIEGITLDKFVPSDEKTWDDIFIDAIKGFEYLEKHNILHRDIRCQNFMVTSDNVLKIIDFGFGKKVTEENCNENSVALNWPVSQDPEEFVLFQDYSEATEIYYLGEMFFSLIDRSLFSYRDILKKMCSVSFGKRYHSFSDILVDISNDLFSQIDFSSEEKNIYHNFIDSICNVIESVKGSITPQKDPSIFINKLGDMIRSCAIENHLINVGLISPCFISNLNEADIDIYYPDKMKYIKTEYLKDFYKMFLELSNEKKQIIMENFASRFLSIKQSFLETDLPF